jgi:hypothetical protein
LKHFGNLSESPLDVCGSRKFLEVCAWEKKQGNQNKVNKNKEACKTLSGLKLKFKRPKNTQVSLILDFTVNFSVFVTSLKFAAEVRRRKLRKIYFLSKFCNFPKNGPILEILDAKHIRIQWGVDIRYQKGI